MGMESGAPITDNFTVYMPSPGIRSVFCALRRDIKGNRRSVRTDIRFIFFQIRMFDMDSGALMYKQSGALCT
jgi:hypothetical protein